MNWTEAIEFIYALAAQHPNNPVVQWLHKRVDLGHRTPELMLCLEALKAIHEAAPVAPSQS